MTLLLTFPALITFIAPEETNPTKNGTSTTVTTCGLASAERRDCSAHLRAHHTKKTPSKTQLENVS